MNGASEKGWWYVFCHHFCIQPRLRRCWDKNAAKTGIWLRWDSIIMSRLRRFWVRETQYIASVLGGREGMYCVCTRACGIMEE